MIQYMKTVTNLGTLIVVLFLGYKFASGSQATSNINPSDRLWQPAPRSAAIKIVNPNKKNSQSASGSSESEVDSSEEDVLFDLGHGVNLHFNFRVPPLDAGRNQLTPILDTNEPCSEATTGITWKSLPERIDPKQKDTADSSSKKKKKKKKKRKKPKKVNQNPSAATTIQSQDLEHVTEEISEISLNLSKDEETEPTPKLNAAVPQSTGPPSSVPNKIVYIGAKVMADPYVHAAKLELIVIMQIEDMMISAFEEMMKTRISLKNSREYRGLAAMAIEIHKRNRPIRIAYKLKQIHSDKYKIDEEVGKILENLKHHIGLKNIKWKRPPKLTFPWVIKCMEILTNENQNTVTGIYAEHLKQTFQELYIQFKKLNKYIAVLDNVYGSGFSTVGTLMIIHMMASYSEGLDPEAMDKTTGLDKNLIEGFVLLLFAINFDQIKKFKIRDIIGKSLNEEMEKMRNILRQNGDEK